MAATINGSAAAVQNRTTVTFTPGIGGTYGGRYEGPRAAIETQMQTLILAGYAVQFECDSSPVATVTFSTPSKDGGAPTNPNADYTDNFQVLRNTVQKELLMSDHSLVAVISELNLQELKTMMLNSSPPVYETGNRIATGITGAGTWAANGHPTNSPAAAQYMLDLHLSGVRSIEVKQPVLRVTRVTNPKYDVPFDVSNVDKLLTTTRMITDSGVPSNFAVPIIQLAAAFQRRTALNGQGYSIRNDNLGLKFGWLKDAVTSETVGTTRNQYVLEYKFGLWDVEIYGVPI